MWWCRAAAWKKPENKGRRKRTSTSYGQVLHQSTQVVQVARQAVHAVHYHRIILAYERKQCVELGSLDVLAGYFFDKNIIKRDVFQLSFRVLIESAHANVADAMT